MKYSTARWLTIILVAFGIISISTYFYLDSIEMMIPILAVIIKPLMMILLFPAVTILLANVLASTKQEERIKKHHFQKAVIIVISLFTFKLITNLLSK